MSWHEFTPILSDCLFHIPDMKHALHKELAFGIFSDIMKECQYIAIYQEYFLKEVAYVI